MKALWRDKKEGLISLGVLLGLLVVLVSLLMGPVLYQADRYRSELRRDARMLQELRAIEAVRGEIEELRQSYHQRNLHEWVYESRNTDEISLDVQRKVSAWLGAAQVQRITPVTSRNGNEHVAVGVQVQFIATLDELLAFAREIESSRPLLMVEHMRLSPHAQRRGRDQPEAPQMLSVQMSVQTYIPAGEE